MNIDYNRTELINLLKSFYDITGLRIGISDTSRKEVCCYPFDLCSFCSILRSNKKAEELCCRCDEEAFQKAAKSSDVYLYECHIGLTEACCTLLYQNTIIGYIMIGQFMTDKMAKRKIMSNCSLICADSEQLSAAFDDVKKVSGEFVGSALTILKACIQYIYIKGLLRIRKASLASSIEDYINNNISQRLIAQEIARALNTNRTSVFSAVKDSFGLTLTQFIEQKRMRLAEELLKNGEKSITEVAEICGFSDANYFSRRFTRQFGKSPKNFRKCRNSRS